MFGWRGRFIHWLHYKVTKGKEGEVMKKWVFIIWQILHPFYAMYAKQSGIHYDPLRRIYTIEGQKFSAEFFRNFNATKATGELFRFVKKDGEFFTIERMRYTVKES